MNGLQTQALDNTCFPSLDTVFKAGTEKKLTEPSPHLIIFQGRDQSIFLNLEHFCIELLFYKQFINKLAQHINDFSGYRFSWKFNWA